MLLNARYHLGGTPPSGASVELFFDNGVDPATGTNSTARIDFDFTWGVVGGEGRCAFKLTYFTAQGGEGVPFDADEFVLVDTRRGGFPDGFRDPEWTVETFTTQMVDACVADVSTFGLFVKPYFEDRGATCTGTF